MARSPLGWLNLLLPGDRSGRLAESGIAYGDGLRRRLDVYVPRAAGSGPRPVLVFIYGGGWNSGVRADYSFAGRAFAALGFVTVVPDYRVVPEARFPGFVEDCAAALDWTRANAARFDGDPATIVLAGHSAGAYNAVMLGLDPAGFGASGPIRAVLGLSGPYDFYPFDMRESIEAFAGVPDPAATQPVNLVTPAAPPMFLAHGTRDRIVALRNSTALARRLEEAGVPVDLRVYPGLGHARTLVDLMAPLRWRSTLWTDVTSFLQRVVPG